MICRTKERDACCYTMSHPGCIKLPGTTSVPLGILFFAFTYSSNELVMNLLNSKEWNSILTWTF